MTKALKSELEYLTTIETVRLIVAKQLVENGYNHMSFTKEAKEQGMSRVVMLGLQNAIIDIEKGFVKKEKILDIKLNNL